jgi:hypothetical protein
MVLSLIPDQDLTLLPPFFILIFRSIVITLFIGGPCLKSLIKLNSA